MRVEEIYAAPKMPKRNEPSSGEQEFDEQYIDHIVAAVSFKEHPNFGMYFKEVDPNTGLVNVYKTKDNSMLLSLTPEEFAARKIAQAADHLPDGSDALKDMRTAKWH